MYKKSRKVFEPRGELFLLSFVQTRTAAFLARARRTQKSRVLETERLAKAAGWVGAVVTPTVVEMVVVQGSEVGADDLALLALRADVVHYILPWCFSGGFSKCLRE